MFSCCHGEHKRILETNCEFTREWSEGIEFSVVNALHIKAVPGRKTDVNDAEWIAKLLRHGLIRASYIPNRNQRELRELVRYRRSIIQERARQQNRIQKVLEGANIKLGSVVSQIKGVSSMEMLRAIADGEDDPVKLANLARRTLKKKKEELRVSLTRLYQLTSANDA